MIINEERQRYVSVPLYLSESEEYEVDRDNIGELSVWYGKDDISKKCKVIFNLSKEALMGFGIYTLRLAYNYNEFYHSHIEPLGQLSASQGMGFFLTPNSSEFIIGCKNHGMLCDLQMYSKKEAFLDDINHNKLKIDYLVNLDFDNDYFETHNIGFNNIAEIRVLKDDQDISKICRVSLMLSKNALIGLGFELIRLAHNYSEERTIFLKPLNKEYVNNKFGFYLTTNSSQLAIGCRNLKNVFYYDKQFGTI